MSELVLLANISWSWVVMILLRRLVGLNDRDLGYKGLLLDFRSKVLSTNSKGLLG
jgi:hypothetical protein